jgi:protein SYS1
MGRFQLAQWDAPLLLLQMATMQALFSLSLGLVVSALVLLLSLLSSSSSSASSPSSAADEASGRLAALLGLDSVLGERLLATDYGLVFHTAVVMNAVLAAGWLRVVVRRARQCLDFACTAHLIHLAVVAVYLGRLPGVASWWISIVGSCVLMTIGGENLCRRLEMREITLNVPRTGGGGGAGAEAARTSAASLV